MGCRVFAFAGAVPLLALYGYFAWHHAGWALINDNIFVNFRWPQIRMDIPLATRLHFRAHAQASATEQSIVSNAITG